MDIPIIISCYYSIVNKTKNQGKQQAKVTKLK